MADIVKELFAALKVQDTQAIIDAFAKVLEFVLGYVSTVM